MFPPNMVEIPRIAEKMGIKYVIENISQIKFSTIYLGSRNIGWNCPRWDLCRGKYPGRIVLSPFRVFSFQKHRATIFNIYAQKYIL